MHACREHRRRLQAYNVALSCSNLMKRGMIFRWPRWAPILLALALAVFAIVAISSLREPVLRAVGWALVANDPVAPADIIVLSLDSGGAGALESADLVQSGISKRVAVFMDPPSGEDFEFIRRGLPYEDAGAMQIRELRSLGVTDVVQISKSMEPKMKVGRFLHGATSIIFDLLWWWPPRITLDDCGECLAAS